jgi:hypothetical protein
MPKAVEKKRPDQTGSITDAGKETTPGKAAAGNATQDNATDNASATSEKAATKNATPTSETKPQTAKSATPEKSGNKPNSAKKAAGAVAPVDTKDLLSTAPAKPNAIPSFVVNDNSSVNVISVTHEFQESMARNRFDATLVEASV